MLKAINISAYKAAEITKLPPNTVLISINREHAELFDLRLDRKDNRILTLQFSDITTNDEVNGIIFHTLDNLTALKILDFININKDKNFIIHCARGVSRSSAICLYIHLMYGHELKKDYWQKSNPNSMVLGQLFKWRFKK